MSEDFSVNPYSPPPERYVSVPEFSSQLPTDHSPSTGSASAEPSEDSATFFPVGKLRSPSPSRQSGKRKRWIMLGVLAVLPLLLAPAVSYWGSIYLNRSTPNKTLDTFCHALQQGDYRLAYHQFSHTLQSTVSEQTFTSLFPQDKLIQCDHGTPSGSGPTATASLNLVHASTSKNADLVTLLLKDASWQIDDVRRAPQENPAGSSAIHRFDLPARQDLRDFTADFAVGKGGADTGISVVPDERVEIFVTRSATITPGMSEPGDTLRDAITYSIGITGRGGKVGEHLNFVAKIPGNIFLGVNPSGPVRTLGSFRITIVTLPSGTVGGIWVAPADRFLFQGSALTFSLLAFSQKNPISRVQFTQQSGHHFFPLCSTTHPNGDTYSCQGNVSTFHNGPIAFGFTIFDSWGQPLVNPDGVRAGIVRYVLTQSNDIYAGYAAVKGNAQTGYQKVTAHWVVPEAHCSPDETSDSAIWVGMTSGASDKSLLAQLGTDSGCQSGVPGYRMWWEMFPEPWHDLSDQSLQPGDSVTATVTFQNGEFQLSLDDPKERIHFSTTQPGKVSDTSIAECIVEAPTIVDDPTDPNKGHVAQLTNFGNVSVLCQLNDNEPIADGPQNSIYQMVTQSGVSKATTSNLDQAGSTFTVQWHHG